MPTDQQPPPLTIFLPDRQELQGRLIERQQLEDGTWRYLVALALWRHTETGTIEPAEYRVYLPPEQVRPIDGISYGEVLSHRLPQAPVPTPAGPRWGWRVQQLHHRGGGGALVHVHDCEAAEGGQDVDLDDALAALRRPGARACQRCDAAAALLPLQ
jgi:Family of unknown function (DUF6233)